MSDPPTAVAAAEVPTGPKWGRRWLVMRLSWLALVLGMAACLYGLMVGMGNADALVNAFAWLVGAWTVLVTGYLGIATWQDDRVAQLFGRR